MPYSKFERHTWNDERFRSWKRDMRDMWKYILTCPHGNLLGCFVLDPMYAAADLSAPDDRWTPERAEAALRELDGIDRIAYDWDSRLLLVVRHLKHNHPDNPNVAKSAASIVAKIPFSQRLLERLLKGLLEHTKQRTRDGHPFCSLIVDAVRDRLANPGPGNDLNGSRNPSETVPPTLSKTGAVAVAVTVTEQQPTTGPVRAHPGAREDGPAAVAARAVSSTVNGSAPPTADPAASPAVPTTDQEAQATAIILAANRAMVANTSIDARRFRPIEASHRSRSDVLSWLLEGIPAPLIADTVTARAAGFRPSDRRHQISSMKYFEDAVHEASKRSRTQPAPGSEAASIRDETPGTGRTACRTSLARIDGHDPEEERRKREGAERRAAAEWAEAHPDQAAMIREKITAEIETDLRWKGSLTAKAVAAVIEGRYRAMVAERLRVPVLDET
jgi:hypothetical protein